jgi:hypothetical protein
MRRSHPRQSQVLQIVILQFAQLQARIVTGSQEFGDRILSVRTRRAKRKTKSKGGQSKEKTPTNSGDLKYTQATFSHSTQNYNNREKKKETQKKKSYSFLIPPYPD